ncbi:unnamed protein product, partial [Symbiodinium microadriaticum]
MSVEVVEFPRDVYQDALADYLLLSCLRRLCHADKASLLPRQISLLSRNDLLQLAQRVLDPQDWALLSHYADSADRMVAAQVHSTLPLSVHGHDVQSSAELLARRFLDGGNAPLWSATRQVLLALEYEKPRHASMQHTHDGSSSFYMGAYKHGPHKGLCRATMTHPNTARLLNCFITHLHGQHQWTTTAVLFNYKAPAHIDRHNGPQPNLVTSLSLQDDGDLWIEGPGAELVEHKGSFVTGQRYSLQLQAVRFDAHKLLHMTCPWHFLDRAVLVAYTVGQWEKLPPWVVTRLLDLGFHLPDRTQQIPVLSDCSLPCVIRSDGADGAALSGGWMQQDLGIFTAVPIVQCRRDDSTRKAVEPGKCNFLLLDRLELDSPGQAIRLLLPEFE